MKRRFFMMIMIFPKTIYHKNHKKSAFHLTTLIAQVITN